MNTREIVVVLVLTLLLMAGSASGHRMFVGQKMTLDLVAMFDDGTPATDAIVEIYRDGELYAKNTTDGSGKFSLILPGRGTGEWRFVVSGGGHSEAYKMSIQSSNETGLAAFLAVLMIPAVWICRRGGRRT
ncbi:MAG TPA: hypothetical protein PLI05_11035 [Methanotrichaceae archaeon]|nr:MAG: hypothetical protein A4E47_00289 [Methanosaeta sp. PtaU1.Bin028]HQF17585.1 hypothetical protein [Methanotrichaceae archaeon]HQI92160.1 hypothetical protein [Methanotrichaceae archaeon]